MEQNNSEKLSKLDLISFLAILLLGVAVFFGMNFQTLGDKVPSIGVAILLVVLMTVFVFFAAFAKRQERNREKWNVIEYVMVGLYIVALIPTYFLASKFFDVQFGKDEIVKQAQAEVDQVEQMFKDYNRACKANSQSYQVDLLAKSKSNEGKAEIVKLLNLKNASEISESYIKQVGESYLNTLKGADYKALQSRKSNLVNNVNQHFLSWNMLAVPQYAKELSLEKEKIAKGLQSIFDNHPTPFETGGKKFDITPYTSDSNITEKFSSWSGFSALSLIVVLFLGLLGLLKYFLAGSSRVQPMKQGNASVIDEQGGFRF